MKGTESMSDKATFTFEEKEYTVFYPSARQIKDANIEYAKALADATRKGLLLRDTLDSEMRKQGLWSDEKQKLLEELDKILIDGQTTLKERGGIKKSEARKLAIQMRKSRMQRILLLSDRNKLDIHTVEGMAEQAKFSYLVASCTKDSNGMRVYKNLDDYYDKQDDAVANIAASQMAMLYYGVDKNVAKTLPENEFLIKYGFANEDMRLVDKDGGLVDENGKRIDENGNYLDGEGKVVDESGNAIPQFQEFLDD